MLFWSCFPDNIRMSGAEYRVFGVASTRVNSKVKFRGLGNTTQHHPFPADSIQINRASSAFWRALFIHSVASAALVSKMPCSEVTDAVSPQKRRKSDAVNGHEDLKVLKFAKLTENATTPSRGSNRAAGFDLYRWLDLEPLAEQRCVSVFCSCMLFCTLRFMQNTFAVFPALQFSYFCIFNVQKTSSLAVYSVHLMNCSACSCMLLCTWLDSCTIPRFYAPRPADNACNSSIYCCFSAFDERMCSAHAHCCSDPSCCCTVIRYSVLHMHAALLMYIFLS